MSKKLTPWFPHKIKPVHVGWYDAEHRYEEDPWYWDGKLWRNAPGSWVCLTQNRKWRGLLVKPE